MNLFSKNTHKKSVTYSTEKKTFLHIVIHNVLHKLYDSRNFIP